MAATRLVSKQSMKGSTVHVRYLDHCWFRNVDPKLAKPIVQDAWGILHHEAPDHIQLIAASYTDPTVKEEAVRATGLVIVRSTILEMNRVG